MSVYIYGIGYAERRDIAYGVKKCSVVVVVRLWRLSKRGSQFSGSNAYHRATHATNDRLQLKKTQTDRSQLVNQPVACR